ncbi:hypothetical protein G6F56_006504 [Rhizopus delemar]|nr:hypothetical protein G6F56_006504 [Rhizopus delemar]
MASKKEQVMIPDFALYLDPLTVASFELFVIEVKKPGNFSNGHLELDLVNLSKEMQLALDKLIEKKVKNPEVVALLVEGVMEKMHQLQATIQGTLERLYKAIQGQESAEDHRSYRREACGSPVAVRKDQINV